MTEERLPSRRAEQRRPDLPPPVSVAGPIGWLRDNLFARRSTSLLTVLALSLIYSDRAAVVNWAILNATWTVPDRRFARRNARRQFSDCGPERRLLDLRAAPASASSSSASIRKPSAGGSILVLCARRSSDLRPAGGARDAVHEGTPRCFFFVAFPIVSFWLLRGGLGLRRSRPTSGAASC